MKTFPSYVLRENLISKLNPDKNMSKHLKKFIREDLDIKFG